MTGRNHLFFEYPFQRSSCDSHVYALDLLDRTAPFRTLETIVSPERVSRVCREIDPGALQRLIVEENIWAFGEKTPGRKSVKPGDWVCFYLSKKGVVAHGQVSSNPTYLKHPNVRDPEKYPWVFKLINTVVYPESPTRLDGSLRKRLDSFKDRDPNKRWGWFVQSNRKITEYDFNNLIKKTT